MDEYDKSVELGLQAVLREGPIELLPARSGGAETECIIIFGSDQGMTGGFNERIVSWTMESLKERAEYLLVCVGARAHGLILSLGRQVSEIFPVPASTGGITEIVDEILLLLNRWREERRIGKVDLFFNILVSRSSFEPQKRRLLPLDGNWLKEFRQKKWPSRAIPTYAMDRNRLFSALIRRYLFVSLYRAFAQSMASENASRLSSMQAAEKNIGERLEDLQLRYRQQRQDSITSELLDISSGFETMKCQESPEECR